MKKILVTGGAGFVGANLVRVLLNSNFHVTVLDNLSVGNLDYIRDLEIKFVDADILDSDAIDDAVSGHDGIVHLAAQTGVPGSLLDPRKDCETNIIGTLNLLEAARHHGIKRFVFASSNAPLGRQKPPATEDKAPLPISPYGASKLAGEGYCLAYHGSWGLGTVVLRFANLYGPFSAHKGSVVAKFVRDIEENGQIVIDGDGQQTRDFINVGDLCQAVVLALQSNVGGEIFQIATGVETSIIELAQMVQQIMGHNIVIDHGPDRQGDIRKNYSKVSKAQDVLGWVPKIPLEIGLQDSIRWFLDADIK